MTDSGDRPIPDTPTEDKLAESPILGEILGGALPKMEMFHAMFHAKISKEVLIWQEESQN